MPLPGGAADKFGNRYEGRWTVSCMIEVLRNQADSIRLEPPGEEGKGAEFYLSRAGNREYHQVKRQIAGEGRWSIGELKKKGVLGFFFEKLKSPTSSCVFVSADSAYQIREMSERAMATTSLEEYKKSFLSSSEHQELFSNLQQHWEKCSEEECYSYLKRIKIETVSEGLLQNHLESKISALLDGDPSTISALLTKYALDNVHRELFAYDIYEFLKSQSIRTRDWAADSSIMARIDEQNESYLSGLRGSLINGKFLFTNEPELICKKLYEKDSLRGIMVTGDAGIGKSSILLKGAEEAQNRQMPLLAFRVDNLQPVIHPKSVGTQLQLPDSPALVLANIAKAKSCLLIIDQLDAISLASGRNTSFFECIRAIINQAIAHPNIKLLVACRLYDLKNDHRIEQLTEKGGQLEIHTLQPLPRESITAFLKEIGLDSGRLTDRQIELIGVPERLRLLAEVAQEDKVKALSFTTEKDLYDKFWDYKERQVRIRLDHAPKFMEVTNLLCEHMAKEQSLSAPSEILDGYKQDAEAMASEHVLIIDNKRYRFFHEGFFDYCFARKFLREERGLLDFLLGGEQHLFHRSLVRQILTYLRDANRNAYLESLSSLLKEGRIRFHIKRVALDFLASLNSPQKDEWQVLEPLFSHSDSDLVNHLWMTIRSFSQRPNGWPTLLDSLGQLEKWLASNDGKAIDGTIILMSLWQEARADRVAELLAPYATAKGKWPMRIFYLINHSDLTAGRGFFDFFLFLVKNDLLDNGAPPDNVIDLGDLFYALKEKKPGWACEAAGLIFKKRLISYVQHPESPNQGRYGIDISRVNNRGDLLDRCANGSPVQFLNHVFPVILEVLELDSQWDPESQTQEPLEAVFGTSRYDRDILESIEDALTLAASTQPAMVMKLLQSFTWPRIKKLRFGSGILGALTGLGPNSADFSISYLADGFSAVIETSLATGPKSRAKVAKFIETVSANCTSDSLEDFSRRILDFYPSWERKAEDLEQRGITQYWLLEAIPEYRRTPEVKSRLDEWERKHGPNKAKPTPDIKEGFARRPSPPIPPVAFSRMSDENWIEAMQKYNKRGIHLSPDGELVGGAEQLASGLAAEAKKAPERFAKLILKLPEITSTFYFNAILDSVSEFEIDLGLFSQICAYCHRLPGHPCGASIVRAIGKKAQENLPDDLVNILIWHVLYHPEAITDIRFQDGEKGRVGELLTDQSINSTRGQAIDALASLIHYHPNKIDFLKPVLEKLVSDPLIQIRCSTAEVLIYLLNHQPDLAVSLFLELVQIDDKLLCTRFAEDFLHYASRSHFLALKHVVERMLNSQEEEVVNAGARRACIASLYHEGANELAKLALNGNEAQRMGAAQIYSANLGFAEFQDHCEKALVQLFNDASEKIRQEAASCFYKLDRQDVTNYPELMTAFIKSPSFESSHEYLLRALEECDSLLPELCLPACARFLDIAGQAAGDMQKREAFAGTIASRLIVRLYSQTRDDGLKSKCLDLIDRMMAIRIIGLDENLENIRPG